MERIDVLGLGLVEEEYRLSQTAANAVMLIGALGEPHDGQIQRGWF